MWAEVGSSGVVIIFIGVFARMFTTRISKVESDCVKQKVYDERQKTIDESLEERVKQGAYDERQKAIDENLKRGEKKFIVTEETLAKNTDLLARVDEKVGFLDEKVGFLIEEWRRFKNKNNER
jgi:hypothetical protein